MEKYNQIRIELGALATGMFYAAQKDRISAFNRIRQIIYRKVEGKELTEKSEKKEEDDKSRGKMSDAAIIKYIIKNKEKLEKEEQEYVEQIVELLQSSREKENSYKHLMQLYVEQEPIYQNWLKNIKGISTLNTANLLQYFGYCEKAKHCSSLWKYAGLHVVNGAAPKLQKSEEGKGLDWNPKLRTLMYRIGDCLVKQRTKGYRDIYDTEKAKQVKLMESKAEGAPKRLLHAELRARRKMIKAFLQDYYNNCLIQMGKTPEPPYSARFHPNEAPN